MNRGDRREPIFRDHADRQRFVEAMLAQKQVTSRTHDAGVSQPSLERRAERKQLTEGHVIVYMSQSMKGFYLRFGEK
jgi:hypothetical protein